MINISDILSDVRQTLDRDFDISADVRYFRRESLPELSSTTRYYIEPGAMTLDRINVATPRLAETVRVISERQCPESMLVAAVVEQITLFENIGRELLRRPRLTCGAFLLRATTFSDAPSGVSVEAIESGYSAVFGGIELTFVVG